MSEPVCKFELGDVVRLKSGGQTMCVEEITTTTKNGPDNKPIGKIFNVKCVWMPERPEHGPWKRETFPEHVLTLAENSSETLATMKQTPAHDGKDKKVA